MNKKLFLCCLFSGFLLLSSSALGEESADEPVTVVFNQKAYSGTLKRSDTIDTFYPDKTNDNDFIITGKWAKTAFKGDCTVTYEDGTVWDIFYKNRLMTKDVQITNPDGSYITYTCSSGKPCGAIRTFSKNGSLTDIDWFYQCVPISDLKGAALTPSYKELTENPYDYYGLPISIFGTITNIYETGAREYVEIRDSDGNHYVFNYYNLKVNRYRPTDIQNLLLGDTITVYGYYSGLSTSKKLGILYEHQLGYLTDDDVSEKDFVSSAFFSKIKDMCNIKSFPSLKNDFPFIDAFSVESHDTYPPADPLNLTGSYKEICLYPLYYHKVPVSICGTVVYENRSESDDEQTLTLLVKEFDTGNLYIATKKTDSDRIYLNESVSCIGFYNGNGKIHYYDLATDLAGYTVYPNMTAETLTVIS